jgi:hypothetical protein
MATVQQFQPRRALTIPLLTTPKVPSMILAANESGRFPHLKRASNEDPNAHPPRRGAKRESRVFQLAQATGQLSQAACVGQRKPNLAHPPHLCPFG